MKVIIVLLEVIFVSGCISLIASRFVLESLSDWRLPITIVTVVAFVLSWLLKKSSQVTERA
ncbi:hypothetical protein [Pontibacillus salipaludis]|uniref:Uncharacterized protein n=1 Tax=Pontibacillus salipaludis TaxID=1697394 RepID=A0ABQ1Q4T2_9BACI|nr:hypothetical protein [Pontibacillus salipaludis]GGD12880.1 hypothetical protein GCM10011389_20530 [Pontibacillus salipaludis]